MLNSARFRLLLFAMLSAAFSSTAQAQTSLGFDQCTDDLEGSFEKLASEAKVITGFSLCPEANFPWDIVVQLSNSPEKSHSLAQLFGVRTPGYRTMQIDGRASFEIRPFTKNIWSVEIFDDHGNRDVGTSFIWARDMSESERPFVAGALDWSPVKYFDCYRTSKAGDREGLNCLTRYHITTCSRFFDKHMSETWFDPEFTIRIHSYNDTSTNHLFEHFEEVHTYVEGVLNRLLEFSCS
ncbi:hypothetical protein [Celeribacter baekdonensis]|uniref:hypothetical protein n=1 Tax=Celeribacter baekdonensis TaxID=875171 RepID=UPI00131F230F|nr:hypothetical protein [Celeribacter baekdonensis]